MGLDLRADNLLNGKQISEELGITYSQLNRFRLTMKLNVVKIKYKTKTLNFYKPEEYKIIVNHFSKGPLKEKPIQTFCKDLNLEELKKEHPLVTDNELFDTRYFPDTIPEIYKGCEDD